jgi:hypothetical protein
MSPLDDQAARVEAAVEALLDMRGPVEAAAPWPLAELYGTEAEASWGAPELLAHATEMLPFWLGEAERILDADPAAGPIAIGRIADDPLRIGLIGRDRQVPLRELFARLEANGPRVARRMRELSADEAARTGLHQTVGELSIADLFERFIVGHIESHVTQLREILATHGA